MMTISRKISTRGYNADKLPTASEPFAKWLDKLIRLKTLPCVNTSARVFTSWNIIGSGLCFMCMGIINTIMLWIPTYLKDEKGSVLLIRG
jgi:hypothetical protein